MFLKFSIVVFIRELLLESSGDTVLDMRFSWQGV
jgi:hypothetical protein